MEKSKVEQVAEQVIGLIPLYTQQGNVTEVLLKDEESLIDRRNIRSVLSALARTHALDLSAQRNQIQRQLNHQGVLPFYLSPDRVFAAFKMRHPICGNDMAYGFIDQNYIKRFSTPDKESLFLLLINGREIQLTSGHTTAAKSLDYAHSLHKLLEELKTSGTPTSEDLHNAVGVIASALIADVKYIKDQLEQLTERSSNKQE